MRDRASQIERVVDASAAVLFGAATAFSCLRLWLGLPVAALAAVAGFCCSFAVLRAVRPEERHFSIGDFSPAESRDSGDELDLYDDDKAEDPIAADSGELVLDDVLAELGPDSRVVRLFDPAAMPTPGELQARIRRHLGPGHDVPEQALEVDASEALHEALAELRRSLR